MPTMIELAVVLVVKQTLEWENSGSNGKRDRDKLETKSQIFDKIVKVDPIEGMGQDFKEEKDEEIQSKPSVVKKLGLWIASSATNKIDFVSFTVFLFAYFVFNFIYWVHYI